MLEANPLTMRTLEKQQGKGVQSRLAPAAQRFGDRWGLTSLAGSKERGNDLNKALCNYLVIVISFKFRYLRNIEGYRAY